jgi:glycosyltransferase involved in cell wall biosynthesis
MTTPTVSLIMTVHNREAFLGLAIESILVQTFSHFELILWDDGSTDQSLEIARHYAQHDPRIRLFAAPHQGRVGALKSAHEQVRGQYVGWVDSDDVLESTALTATTTVLMEDPSVGMVYTNYWIIDGANRVQGLGRRCQTPYSQEQLLVEFMTFHFRLIRQSVYRQVGGVDGAFPCAMDYDLCLKLSEVAGVRHLAEPLYYYRQHGKSISQQQRLVQIECSQRAVENALRRRGMAEDYELDVEVMSRFYLRPRRSLPQKQRKSSPITSVTGRACAS